MRESDNLFDEPEFHCCEREENHQVLSFKNGIWKLQCAVCKAVWTVREEH